VRSKNNTELHLCNCETAWQISVVKRQILHYRKFYRTKMPSTNVPPDKVSMLNC